MSDIRCPDDLPQVKCAPDAELRFSSPDGPARGPAPHRTRAGATIEVDVSSFVLSLEGRAVKLALVNDVTERRKAENELRAARACSAGSSRTPPRACR